MTGARILTINLETFSSRPCRVVAGTPLSAACFAVYFTVDLSNRRRPRGDGACNRRDCAQTYCT